MRFSKMRATAVALLVLAAAIAAPAVASAGLTRTSSRLSTGGTAWESPAVSGDIVAWYEQDGGGIWRVKVKNVATGKAWTAGSNTVQSIYPLAVGQGSVAWVDKPGTWERVVRFDAADGHEGVVASAATNAGPAYTYPVFGDRLMWVDDNWGSTRYWIDDESVIATAMAPREPAVFGSTLVYGDTVNTPGQFNIWTRELQGPFYQRAPVTSEATHGHFYPDISTDYIVWEDVGGPAGHRHIGIYDRRATGRDWLTGNTDPATYDAYHPATSRAKFVWESTKYGEHDVFAYDSYRSVEITLTRNSSAEAATQPDIDGKRVAYQYANILQPGSGVYMSEWLCTADRISGATRYDVAVDAARKAYPEGWAGVHHVVVASGADAASADPLAAGGLCWAYDAPLLLISPTAVPAKVKALLNEIRLASGSVTVHVVGGTASIPGARLTDLKAVVGTTNVERLLATGNRYDLAKAIALRMHDVRGGDMDHCRALICNGADPTKFMETAAASAISRSRGYPVLLVSKTVAPAATKQALAALSVESTFVIGNTSSVSNAVATQLGVLPGSRWGASTQAGTLRSIAENATYLRFANPSKIAAAAKLPDALTAGCLVGRPGASGSGGLLLLTSGTALTSTTGTYIGSVKADVSQCWVMGGTVSISNGVKNAINLKLR